jgi:hypothetical protein
MDGDGERDPKDIPKLVSPVLKSEADIVLGIREAIARPPERFINWLTRWRMRVEIRNRLQGLYESQCPAVDHSRLVYLRHFGLGVYVFRGTHGGGADFPPKN